MPASRSNLLSWSMAGAVLFFIVLWLSDFPKPWIDDLFFCGAGFNLANGGDFSNSLIIRQNFPGHYFFVYPPLHSYAVAGWVSVFGINTVSLLAFQAVAYIVIAGSAIAVLRRHNAPTVLEWLVPLGVSGAFLASGLRPEAFAAALIMAGLAVFETSTHRRFFTALTAFTLIFLGGSAAPRFGPFAAVLTAAAFFVPGSPNDSGWRRLAMRLAAAAAALGIAALVFLAMIQFRLSEFLHAFRYHATLVTDNGFGLLLGRYLREMVGVRQWPLLAVAFLMLAFSFNRAGGALRRAGWVLAAGMLVSALLRTLSFGSTWFVALMALTLGGSILGPLSKARRWIVIGLLCVAFIAANVNNLLMIYGLACGKISSKTAPAAELRDLQSTSQHPVLVDYASARYLFDYRLPAGCLDWCFAAPFPYDTAIQTQINSGDLYVIGPSCVDSLNDRLRTKHPLEKWAPLGSKRWTWYRNPKQVFLIPATDLQ